MPQGKNFKYTYLNENIKFIAVSVYIRKESTTLFLGD
jgi:hypothetical protein